MALWTPAQGVTLLPPKNFLERKKVITLPNGKRAQLTIKDGGLVAEIEHDHHQDAVVRPKPVKVVWRNKEG